MKLRTAVLMGVVVIAACAGPGGTTLPGSTGRQVEIESLAGANQDHAVAVDIVFVDNEAALAALPSTAPEWFQNRAMLRAALGDDVTVVSLQVPPSRSPFSVALPAMSGKPEAVLGFADYLDPAGQPVGDLTAFRCARMTLGASTVSYAECD